MAEFQDLADAHILFADDAPTEMMVNLWLHKRLASELLEKMGRRPGVGSGDTASQVMILFAWPPCQRDDSPRA